VGERGVYLFGVAAGTATTALPRGTGGLDTRYPLELVEQGDLVALASAVDVAWLQEQLQAAENGDLASLEPLVRAHEDVLARALEADAVVPFRFATIFPSAAELRAFVAERERELEETLERLSGAREWGVKGLLDPEAAEAAATADDPQLAELAARAGEGSGSAFFARKRLDAERAERVRGIAAELAEACHDRLRRCAREATVNPPQPPELSGYAMPMVLNGAYLVEREREDELRAGLDELRAEHADRGLVLELTGPWPAYNFVGATPAAVG
jgi:Gas vesicle synthesis protein GvpL/GvpF